MNKFFMILISSLIFMYLFGCTTYTKDTYHPQTYYENGQVKQQSTIASKEKKEGFDPQWSGGANKRMPFSEINLSGVKAGF